MTMDGTTDNEQVVFAQNPAGTENGGVTTDQISNTGWIALFPTVEFGNKTNVTFQGNMGNDTYTVNITRHGRANWPR